MAENKEPVKKKSKFSGALSTIIVAVVIVFFISTCGRDSSKTSTAPSKNYYKNSDSLCTLLIDVCSDADSPTCNIEGESIDVYYDAKGSSYDENDFVRTHLSSYINFCKTAYALDDVDKITFNVYANMTDSRGNSDRTLVMVVCMDKNAFSLYNWENMKYVPGLVEQMAKDSEQLQIHPGILKETTPDKIYYVSR